MKFLRVLTRILAAAGLLVALITLTPAVDWYAVRLAGPWSDPKGATLVVLGAEMLGTRLMGPGTYWRAVYAADAFRADGFEHVLASGTGAADAMAEFLRLRGVPAAAIHVEGASRSTRENALEARALVGKLPGPAVLMTSDYHMFRAHRAFARAGVRTLPRPIPDALKRARSPAARWTVFLDECAETARIVYYFARGWL